MPKFKHSNTNSIKKKYFRHSSQSTKKTITSTDSTDFKHDKTSLSTPTPDMDEIGQLISRASQKISRLEQAKAKYLPDNSQDSFDGVNSQEEDLLLLKEQLRHTESKAKELELELEKLKENHSSEKEHLEKSIKLLKTELKVNSPLPKNKIFTFSKEIKEAVEEIKSLTSSENTQTQTVLPPTTNLPMIPETSQPSVETPQTGPEPSIETLSKSDADIHNNIDPQNSLNSVSKNQISKTKKIPKRKKLMILGGIILVILTASGAVGISLTNKPKVNQELVNQYLQNTGQVQGAQSKAAESQNKGDKKLDVPLEATVWETYKDPIMGIQFQYPANVTEKLMSQSSITLLRKDGHLFKLQQINSSDDLKTYWESIKSIGLEYEAKETMFKNHKALFLQLKDTTEYPGDRYLIKIKDSIFDIWFATKSDAFKPEDYDRVQKIIDSLVLNSS